jgi:endonuclease-3
MSQKVNWAVAIQPLLKKYQGKKHPLDYKNIYQLVVMVILSARDSDRHINQIAPELFNKYPNMAALSKASADDVGLSIKGVLGSENKSKWLVNLAQKIKKDSSIPLTMEELTTLSGIGRKSANVIMREAKVPAVGVMVDLHVVRVAARLGIASGTDPKKIEKQIMEAIPPKDWGEVGMAISFLGREICRPIPKCPECPMTDVCAFYLSGEADKLRREKGKE